MTHKVVLLCTVLTATILQACRSPYTVPAWPDVPAPVRATIQELADKYNGKVDVKEPYFQNGNYMVNVSRLPLTPGGFITYEISPVGQIVSAHGGY